MLGLILSAALASLAAAAGPAHERAEDRSRAVPGSASMGVKACHDDIERFCRRVKPGEGRLGACLKANVKKLSKPCLKWAEHGGKRHVQASLAEIDAAPKTAPPAAKP